MGCSVSSKSQNRRLQSFESYFIRVNRLSTRFQTPKAEAEKRKEEERAHRSYKTKQLFPPSSPSSWWELLLLLCAPNTAGCNWCIVGNVWHPDIPNFPLLIPKCRFSERMCCFRPCQEKKKALQNFMCVHFGKETGTLKRIFVLFSERKFLISDPISGSGSWEFGAPALFGVQRFPKFWPKPPEQLLIEWVWL